MRALQGGMPIAWVPLMTGSDECGLCALGLSLRQAVGPDESRNAINRCDRSLMQACPSEMLLTSYTIHGPTIRTSVGASAMSVHAGTREVRLNPVRTDHQTAQIQDSPS